MMGYTLPTAEMQMNSALLRKIAAANLSSSAGMPGAKGQGSTKELAATLGTDKVKAVAN
jgi:hypothetical protein